jgi:hypothetical protein
MTAEGTVGGHTCLPRHIPAGHNELKTKLVDWAEILRVYLSAVEHTFTNHKSN